MTHPDSDEAFEDFLKRRTLLPPHAPADEGSEPPRALDDLVLAQARRAIQARRQSNTTRRWAIPVALAATSLLCLSVVLNVSLNSNRPQSYSRITTDAPASAPLEPPTASGQLSARAPNAPSAEAQVRSAPAQATADARSPFPAAPAPNASASTAAAPAESTAPESASPPAPAAGAGPTPPEPAPTAAMDRAEPQPESAAPAMARGAAPQTAAAMARDATPQIAPARSPEQDVRAPLEEANVAPGRAKALKRESEVSAVGPHPDDPRIWLAQIAALRVSGKIAEADAEMRRFRVVFPRYPLNPAASEPQK